jgi:hypothetical protein
VLFVTPAPAGYVALAAVAIDIGAVQVHGIHTLRFGPGGLRHRASEVSRRSQARPVAVAQAASASETLQALRGLAEEARVAKPMLTGYSAASL